MDERVWVCDACGAANHHARVRVEKGQRFKEVVLWCHGCQAPRDPNKKPISLAEAKSKPAYIARPHSPTYMVARPGMRRVLFNVLRDSHYSLLATSFLDYSYWEDVLPAGMILAIDKHGNYIPYHPDGYWGEGSDTPVGILHEPLYIESGAPILTAPLHHGKVIERYCYVQDEPVGQIPRETKKALPGVEWT